MCVFPLSCQLLPFDICMMGTWPLLLVYISPELLLSFSLACQNSARQLTPLHKEPSWDCKASPGQDEHLYPQGILVSMSHGFLCFSTQLPTVQIQVCLTLYTCYSCN